MLWCVIYGPPCIFPSIEDVLASLDKQGYIEFIDNEVFIPYHGKYFRRDRHCEDVLVFSADQKDVLKVIDVVVEGKLILQVRLHASSPLLIYKLERS